MKLILGFFASHGGSNMQAIIDAVKAGSLDAELGCVISNNSKSGASDRAEKEGIPFYHISSKTHPDESEMEKSMIAALESNNVNLVILAGYMKKIGSPILEKYQGRILNIHPALLPKYGGQGMYGMNVHKAVVAAGEKESGATIHIVDEVYDNGRILAQSHVPVLPEDTPDDLAARVLKTEHQLYTDTLQKIVSGEIKI